MIDHNSSTSLCIFTCIHIHFVQAKLADAGSILADAVREFMQDLGVENGLTALGFTSSDIGDLVNGTLPQVCLVEPNVIN